MGKVLSNQFKTVLGNTNLSLTANIGESFMVRDILIANPASAALSVQVDRFTAGFFRVSGELGSHLPLLTGAPRHAHDITTGSTAVGDQTSFADLEDAAGGEIGVKVLGGLAADTIYPRAMNYDDEKISGYMGILRYLEKKGVFEGIPVPSGKTLTLSGAAQAGACQIVVYDIYEEADITTEMQNGQDGGVQVYISYGNTGAAITVAGQDVMDTPVNPVDFDDFPFGARAPENKVTEVLGILASDFAPGENDGTNGIGTEYLKLKRGRVTLGDEDEKGYLLYAKDYGDALRGDYIAEGYSVIGNYSSRDMREPLWFDEPIVFPGGELLTVIYDTISEGTGQSISLAEQEVGFILRVTSV